jgi:ketosteroid isomerase-like protein
VSGTGAVADANSELDAFIARIDAAQDEFAHGRPGAFKALWSHTDDVTLIGGLGGVVERGWNKVGARLDWASSNYAEGDRSNQVVSRSVAGEVAYLVRKEIIEAKIGGAGAGRARQELRVTMVFRRGAEGWRIVHRHADSQTQARTSA